MHKDVGSRMLSIDVGHLFGIGRAPEGDGTEFPASLVARYGTRFEAFRFSLAKGETPLTLSLAEEAVIPDIKLLAEKLKAKYENVLLVGIGGSALGARAILQFLRGPFYNLEQHDEPRMFVLDNLDPVIADKLGNILDFKKTALVYVSKSGSTPETAANFIHFFKKYRESGANVRDLVIVCDPADNGINRIARSLQCHLLHIPRALPGRYSVLSTVGFLPAELIGVDSRQLLEGALAVHRAVLDNPPQTNALFALGSSLFELALKGKSIHVLFCYSSLLYDFGLWFMQLWAESLGKRLSLEGNVVHAGTTPLASLGATDQHSLLQLFKEGPGDKVFGFVKVDNVPEDIVMGNEFPGEIEYSYFAGQTMGRQLGIEQLATEMSLVGAGHPCYRILLEDISPRTLGALFYFYEALVVFVAALWNINPFDQPGVEEGKNITYSLMGREDYAQRRLNYERKVKEYDQGRKTFRI